MPTVNAYTCVDCTDIFNENELEHGCCPGCDSSNIQLIEAAIQVVEEPVIEVQVEEITQIEEVVQVNEVTPIIAPANQRVSRHFNHVLCQELMGFLNQVNIDNAFVIRNDREVPLLTTKELDLLVAFEETGYNIKKTGEVLGCTHTNVWQRLYGQERSNAKGILGKLREFVQAR